MTCEVEGCQRPPRARCVSGPCEMHYYRRRRGGTDDLRRPPTGRATTSNGYVLVRRPGHPLDARSGRQRGWVLEHRVVLYDVLGPGAYPCHWCGAVITWDRSYPEPDGLVVDHIDGDKENNEPSNLVPSCGVCNLRRQGVTQKVHP